MSRSVRLHEFGGPDVLKIEDVVVPDPGAQEVRLRVKAIGLNRSEVLTRSGKSAIKPTLPAQLLSVLHSPLCMPSSYPPFAYAKDGVPGLFEFYFLGRDSGGTRPARR